MNRSITESAVVGLAVAIAVSLLASACGPNNMKALKTGQFDVLPKSIDARPTDEKIAEVIRDQRDAEIAKSNQPDPQVEKQRISSATEFANRFSYIQFVHNKDGSQMLFKAMLQAKNNQIYEVQFTDPTLDSTGKILFKNNIAKQFLANNKLSDQAVRLPYTAKAIILENGLSVVSIAENTSDKKSSEISAVVKANNASTIVNSNDTKIQLMQDARVRTRITQLFVEDTSLDNAQRPVSSLANRIIINVSDSKTGKGIYDFHARFQPGETTAPIFASNAGKDLESKYDMSILSGDTFINSDKVSLVFKSKENKGDQFNVVLNLTAQEDFISQAGEQAETTEESAPSDENQTTNADKTEIEFESYAVPLDAADFSHLTGNITSTAKKANKADSTNVNGGMDSSAKSVKPDQTKQKDDESKKERSALSTIGII